MLIDDDNEFEDVESGYSPTLEEDLIVQKVMSDFSDSVFAIREKHNKFADYLEHYMNLPQIKRPRGMANITIPMAPQHVDTINADLIEKQYASDGVNIDVLGREGVDKFQAQPVRDLIRAQLHQANGRDILRDLNFMSLVYGTAPYKVIYDEEYEYMPVRRQIENPFLPEYSDSYVDRVLTLKYKGPKVIPIDIFDFYPHKAMVDIDKDLLPICHRIHRPMSYFKSRKDPVTGDPIYKNLQFIQVDKFGNASTASDDDMHQRSRRQQMSIMVGSGAVHTGIECIEWEGWYKWEGEEQWCIATVGPNGVLMRFEPLPYYERMYGAQRLFRIPNEFWGIGIIEKNHMIIHAHNAITNITIDAFYQGVNPQTLVANNAIDDAEMVARAGQLTHVNSADGEKPLTNYVYRMEPQFVSQDAYILQDRLEKYGEDLSTVTDIKKGSVPSSRQTATAIQTSFSQASIRFKDLLYMIEGTGLLVICRKMHKINLQFFDAPEVINVVGQNGMFWPRKITPEQIAANVDFVSLASSRELDRAMNIQQLSNLLNISMGNQMLMPVITPLFMKLAEEMKIPNLDELQQTMQWWTNQYQMYQMWLMQQQQMYGYGQQPQQMDMSMNRNVAPQELPQATDTQGQIASNMESYRNQIAPRIS